MSFLFRHIKTSPSLIPLTVFVGGTIGVAGWSLGHKLRQDPTIVTMAKSDPFPYLRVKPYENLKLFSVNQKFEEAEEEHIDLMDILSDRYDN